MQLKRLLWVAPLILLITTAFMTGCSELEIKGTAPSNQEPVVRFINVPNDSSEFSYNPVVYWTGDDIDGIITEYFYRVVLKDSITGTPVDYANSITEPDSLWLVVEATSDTAFLYASFDPDIYLEQYLFLCAQDDDGAYSDVVFKSFSRNNHAPNTYIETEFGLNLLDLPYYSYPYLTDNFEGLTISWYGTDSLDYPQEQPDFEYHYTLYGPFDTRPDSSNFDTTMVYVAYDSASAILDTLESHNPEANSVWVRDQDITLSNLRTGYYVFRVRARDDAFVVDSTDFDATGAKTSLAIFRALQPYYSSGHDSLKKILVVNDTKISPLPGNIPDITVLRSFYMSVLQGAGIDTTTEVSWIDNPVYNQYPDPDELVKHELILAINDDWLEEFGESTSTWYSRYLDVGGKIMVTGRLCFLVNRTNQIEPFDCFYGSDLGDYPGNRPTSRFGEEYFNLFGGYFPGWFPFPGVNQNLNQENMGAYAYDPSFPDINYDTLKVLTISHSPYYDTLLTYLPSVEYIMRNNQSQTLYTFKSYQPHLSEFDGWPIAVRYAPTMELTGTYMERTAYMTSYFAFPLYYCELDDAIDIMELMLDWYGL
ncbi:MAG: hypothetical protein GY855_08890 [candidate division Zixibacteria bacterium]|nr:hypothetical protein [candidate division Zixibacteria bacterium]